MMRDHTRGLLVDSDRAVAIVLGVESVTSLGIIRSLGRHGVPVVGIGRRGPGLGGASTYCTACETATTEEELKSLLLAMGLVARCPPVVFTESDEALLFLDRYRHELSALRWLPALGPPLPELINKRTMLTLARQARLDLPVTFFSDEASAAEIAAATAWPCFVKPLHTQSGYRTKGEIAADPGAFVRIVATPRFADGYMAQEIIPGPVTNLFFYLGYWDRSSRPRARVTGYKIRQLPPDFGIGTLAVSSWQPEVVRLAEGFLTAIGFQGLADLEFKFDPRDRRYKFIEINPRPCGLIELAAAAGLDMVYLAYEELTTGGSLGAPLAEAKDGLVWMSRIDDLITCLKYRRAIGGFALADWLQRAWSADCDALWAADDCGPFLARISAVLKKKLTRHDS